MGCKPILEHHRRVVAALMLTFGVNGPLDTDQVQHDVVHQVTNLKRLYVKSSNQVQLRSFLSSPILSHLCLGNLRARETTRCVIDDVSHGEQSGQTPMLHHLSLVNCTRVKSRIAILFQSIWPQLRHLNLLKSELSETDLEALNLACNGPGKTLPNLTSLFLSIPNGITDLHARLFGVQWSNLNFLYVDYPMSDLDIHTGLCEAMKDGKLEYI